MRATVLAHPAAILATEAVVEAARRALARASGEAKEKEEGMPTGIAASAVMWTVAEGMPRTPWVCEW
jgi:hypothetical protein